MMKTIVLRKNQLMLFSVIRFYSQRAWEAILKWKCYFAWSGWEEIKRKRDSLHGETPSSKGSTPFNHVSMCLTRHCRLCAECNKTKMGYRFQPNNCGDVGGTPLVPYIYHIAASRQLKF